MAASLLLSEPTSFTQSATTEKKQETINIFFDVESTSNDPKNDEVLELGVIIGHEKNSPSMRTYVFSERGIAEEAFKIHNISSQMVSKAPTFLKAMDMVLKFIQDHLDKKIGVINGHNIAKFDLLMMDSMCKRLKISTFTEELIKLNVLYYVDTLDVAHYIEGSKKKRLVDIYKRNFDVELPNAHSALGDCEALAALYRKGWGSQWLKHRRLL